MTIQNNKKTILVVDDVESIRTALCEYLSSEFTIWSASDGFEAIDILQEQKIDLILSDIRMPGMGGLQLFGYIQSKPKFQHIIFVLMTAYNVDDYINFVKENKIWNIIPKSTYLDLKYVKVMLQKLTSGNIFGLQKYFDNLRDEYIGLADLHRFHRHKDNSILDQKMFHIKVSSTEENNIICDKIGDILCEHGSPSICRMILEELSANAIIHAPRIRQKMKLQVMDRNEEREELPIESLEIDKKDSFEIGFGFYDNHFFLSVIDYHGTFSRESALSCLERQTQVDPSSGLPVGLTDYHGRGLFISKEHLDQLIFNITPDKKTEILAILDMNLERRTRAISIYQS